MQVDIVNFPQTKVAVVEHKGPPQLEAQSIQKLIDWRIENRMPPSDKHRNYGLHYNDSRTVAPEEYRVDICLSVEQDIAPNSYGLINKVIPACRCAKARHLGSRDRVLAADYLYETWLPASGETAADRPVIFHYVNVGPGIEERDMITDVYLPLV